MTTILLHAHIYHKNFYLLIIIIYQRINISRPGSTLWARDKSENVYPSLWTDTKCSYINVPRTPSKPIYVPSILTSISQGVVTQTHKTLATSAAIPHQNHTLSYPNKTKRPSASPTMASSFILCLKPFFYHFSTKGTKPTKKFTSYTTA